MSKSIKALYSLMGQFFERDDSTIITNGQMFRHAAATPLSNLLLSLELAQQHQIDNPYLTDAWRNAQRLKELVELTRNNLADESGSFRVKLAVAETLLFLDMARSQVQSHPDISTSVSLKGNKFLFQEALLCALKNSLEAYLPSSPLKLVLLTVRATDVGVVISIANGGRGLYPWQKALVFADGFSTKPGGRGVGLSWIRRVIVNHFQGKIEFHSRPQRGTTLTWYLPKFNPT